MKTKEEIDATFDKAFDKAEKNYSSAMAQGLDEDMEFLVCNIRFKEETEAFEVWKREMKALAYF